MIEALAHKLLSSLIGKILIGTFLGISSLRYSAGIYFWKQTNQLERPQYTILKTLSNGVELRRYEPYIIAETTVEGEGFREPTREGFQNCAGYIFGKNKARDGSVKMAMTAPVRVESQCEKMAMTAPVRVSGASKQNTKVSFVIGSKYSLKTAPKPLDKKVKLRQVPGHTLAVRSFSGPPPKDERVRKERTILEESLLKENMRAKSEETLVYGYHDPFITPNLLRRNEVAVLVEGKL